MQMPINFKNWIDENRHLLKPPIGNQVIYKDKEFIIMVVGGPNVRKDYHINEGEEFFYQLEGDIVLRIRQGGKPKDIEINEGDIFLLPPKVPHSPQRFENTVGLVIERKRFKGELDGFNTRENSRFWTEDDAIVGVCEIYWVENRYSRYEERPSSNDRNFTRRD